MLDDVVDERTVAVVRFPPDDIDAPAAHARDVESFDRFGRLCGRENIALELLMVTRSSSLAEIVSAPISPRLGSARGDQRKRIAEVRSGGNNVLPRCSRGALTNCSRGKARCLHVRRTREEGAFRVVRHATVVLCVRTNDLRLISLRSADNQAAPRRNRSKRLP